MNPRLLRPLASGIHPDAAAWKSAVYANGGTVSPSTLLAVVDFCKAIDVAGLRSKFYRLNLFCGSDLNAALVPLYRGTSPSGTKYGNATDTNNGPFVSGDYAETGATGGLTGNGSSKYLDTGLPMNTLPSTTSGHVAVYNNNRSASTTYRGVGGVAISQTTGFGIALDSGIYSLWGNSQRTVSSANGLTVATRISSTNNSVYGAGTLLGTNTTDVTPTASTLNAVFFAERLFAATIRYYDTGRYQAYSIGTGLTQAEVSTYNTIMVAFQTALSRA